MEKRIDDTARRNEPRDANPDPITGAQAPIQLALV